MATYTITALYKKSCEERSFWFKDGQTAIRSEGYRWGTFTKDCDDFPDVDLDNPDGFDAYGEDWELISMDDGCWAEWTWPDDMTEEEQQRLEALWDEEYYEGLENEGWIQDETEAWLYGPLMLKNEDTGEEWRGDELAQILDKPVNIVNQESQSPLEPDLSTAVTDWFPADINPVHLGRYEIVTGVGSTSWPFPSITHADWTSTGWQHLETPVTNVAKWRGLARNPAGDHNGK